MDWIDYKRFVAKYRINYDNKVSHISMLLSTSIVTYSAYRSCAIEGRQEWVSTGKLGVFLYYFAEIENMIQGVSYDRLIEFDDNEWGMLEMAANVSKSCNAGSLNGIDLQVLLSKWVRAYSPIIYCNRVYSEALISSVHHLQEKHGY